MDWHMEKRSQKRKWIKCEDGDWVNLDLAHQLIVTQNDTGPLEIRALIGQGVVIISKHLDTESAHAAMDALFD